MNLTKIETNIKRNLYLQETKNINMHEKTSNIENQVIDIYPEIKFQEIIGFGVALTRKFWICFIQYK